MLTTLWIAAAMAGNADITVKVEGAEARHVFVDGKHRGAGKAGKNVKVSTSTGKHEVAVTYEENARWILCIGEVNVTKDVTIEVGPNRCTNVTKSEPRTENTVRKGAIISFAGAGAKGRVEVGERAKNVLPGMSMLANVAAGVHDVKGPNCTGKVTVSKGEMAAIVLADGTCVGLDAAGGKKKKKK